MQWNSFLKNSSTVQFVGLLGWPLVSLPLCTSPALSLLHHLTVGDLVLASFVNHSETDRCKWLKSEVYTKLLQANAPPPSKSLTFPWGCISEGNHLPFHMGLRDYVQDTGDSIKCTKGRFILLFIRFLITRHRQSTELIASRLSRPGKLDTGMPILYR